MGVMLVVTVCCVRIGWTQSAGKKADLQRQKEEISQKIALTRKLIKESESNQKVTSRQLAVLAEELKYREQLLRGINREIGDIGSDIVHKEGEVRGLNQKLSALKREYAEMIYQAYRNRGSYDKLMFIFSAKDFNQAIARFKLMQRYAEARHQYVERMSQTKAKLSESIQTLEINKKNKELLATEKSKEKDAISENRKSHEVKLSELRKEEKKLREQQRKQESDRRKLTAMIEEVIRKEIEAERLKASKSSTAGESPKSSGSNAVAAPTKTFELAPETKLANADFEKNKGALPWPVSAGVVTSHFGRHPHASIPGIEVNNNGVDFTTENGASVLAVFAGNVSSVFQIPGAGYNVIITHGTYKSVYSGLAHVNVKVGDKVSLKQTLGTVLFDGEENTLHFEIWKVNAERGQAQNPESWIRSR
jgi:septal ring factor EnvC (AmiA/AmiB activator)